MDKTYSQTDPVIWQRLRTLLKSDRKAVVVIVGRFDGPRKPHIVPGMEAEARRRLEDLKQGYGHMGSYDFQIVVNKIEAAMPVNKKEPRQ
jgi:hypothetical protein